jgi:hypothetical protein
MIKDLNPTTGASNFSHLQNVQTGSVPSLEYSGQNIQLTSHSSPSNAVVKYEWNYTHTYMLAPHV